MPSERVRKCFADIKNAIDLINGWSGQAGGAELAMGDVLVRSGIERQLLIISEAAIRLDKLDPTITPRLAPEIVWPGVRGIGNFIRHKYDDLDSQIIVDALNNRLGALKAVAGRVLAAPTE